MVEIQCGTYAFGRGVHTTCDRCGHKTWFPDGGQVAVVAVRIDTVLAWLTMRDTTTGEVLHDCRYVRSPAAPFRRRLRDVRI